MVTRRRPKWPQVYLAAIYTIRKIPTKKNTISPSEFSTGAKKTLFSGDGNFATVANAFLQPSGRYPMEGNAPIVQSKQHVPERNTPRFTQGVPSTKKLPILSPPGSLPKGPDSAKPCTRTTHYAFKWTRRNVLCYGSECEVNPRTLQPRRRAMFILRLGWTIRDQDVTMVQLNRRGDTTQPATDLELHRMAKTHANYELRLILWADQGFVIAVPGDI